MAESRWAAAMLAVMASLTGCGGGDGGPTTTAIDCAWFAADNCWTASVAAAHACVDASASGTFAAGGTDLCTYPDGVRLEFATPAFDSAGGVPWDFTVKAPGGGTCATYRETARTRSLTTRLGTYAESTTGSTLETLTTTITCPDGNRYTIGAVTLGTCDLARLPDRTTSDAGGITTFDFRPAPEADPTFWACRVPPP